MASYRSSRHLLLTFFLIALTSQAFASHFSDFEDLLPTTYHSSQQSGKAIADVNSVKRSSGDASSVIPLTITLTTNPDTHLALFHVPLALIRPSSSTSTASKRDDSSIARRITCPSHSFTISSDCNKRRSRDTRTWRRFCYPNHSLPPGVPYETEYGSCKEEEVCLDGVATDEGRHYAICVNLAGLVLRNGSALGGEQKREGVTKTVQSAIQVDRERHVAAQVVMMEDEGFTAVVAQSLSINALIAGNAQQGDLWQSPQSVAQRCSNCTQIGLASIPPATARLNTNVHLQGHIERARLYVVAVEM